MQGEGGNEPMASGSPSIDECPTTAPGFPQQSSSERHSALEYSLLNGLAQDLDVNLVLNSAIQMIDVEQTAVPDDHLPELLLAGINVSKTYFDPIRAPREVATLLQTVISRISAEEVDNLTRKVCFRGFPKLELPLLRTDPQHDLDHFRHKMKALQVIALQDVKFPPQSYDAEKGEGLEWPQSMRDTARQVEKSTQTDRISMNKQIIQLIQEQLRDDWTNDDLDRLTRELVSYKRTRAREHVTPPLSPQVKAFEPFIPNADVSSIPTPSDLGSRLGEDIAEIEREIFKDEVIVNTSDGISNLDDLLSLSQPDDGCSIVVKGVASSTRRTTADLRVEVPILCRYNGESVSILPVDLAEVLTSTKLATVKRLTSDHEINGPQAENATILEADQNFYRALDNKAQETIRTIEQERVHAIDAVGRVPVPVMDFSVPKPEWHALIDQRDAQVMLQCIIKQNPARYTFKPWPKDSECDQKLRWCPINWSHVSISTKEDFTVDEQLVNRFLALPTEVPTSDQYSWKRDGLAILRHEDIIGDEEELQPVYEKSGKGADLIELVRKRRHFLEDDGSPGAPGARPKKTARNQASQGIPQVGTLPHTLLQDDETGPSTLLSNFLDFRGQTKPKPTTSSYFPNPSPTQPAAVLKIAESAEAIIPYDAAIHPEFQRPQGRIRIIISTETPRKIREGIEQHVGNLELVERDLAAHNTTVWLPGSPCRSEVKSPLAHEASVTISPRTGLVMTSMLHVRQAPLPVLGNKNVLQVHLENVAPKYERLVVLVSQGNPFGEGMGQVSAVEQAAFAGFCGFMHGLGTTVLTYYVGGAEETMSKWVAAMICRYADEAGGSQHWLDERESTWELVLRRAGMNSYAAQATIALLSPPDGEAFVTPTTIYGLPAFVKMSAAERINILGGLFGGTRVLERVGNVFDSSFENM